MIERHECGLPIMKASIACVSYTATMSPATFSISFTWTTLATWTTVTCIKMKSKESNQLRGCKRNIRQLHKVQISRQISIIAICMISHLVCRQCFATHLTFEFHVCNKLLHYFEWTYGNGLIACIMHIIFYEWCESTLSGSRFVFDAINEDEHIFTAFFTILLSWFIWNSRFTCIAAPIRSRPSVWPMQVD